MKYSTESIVCRILLLLELENFLFCHDHRARACTVHKGWNFPIATMHMGGGAGTPTKSIMIIKIVVVRPHHLVSVSS